MKNHNDNAKQTDVVMPDTTIEKVLQGQKALVTGASSGIGKGIALALGQAGADVVVNYVAGKDTAEQVVEDIRQSGSRAFAHKADVSNEDQVKEMFQRMFDEFGTIDILVNNAGIQKDAPIDEMTLDQWKKVIDVNLTGQFLCAREAIREFKRRGVVQETSCAAGKIICVSSVHEIIPWAGHANYAASKGGLVAMTKSIARDFGKRGISAYSIAPGLIKTDMAEESIDVYGEEYLTQGMAFDEITSPEEVGELVAFLASGKVPHMTGSTFHINGGSYMI